MKIFINYLILLTLLSITACVSETEHNKIVSERNELEKENASLKQELEDIKFGAPNLLSDGKIFFDAKEFSNAKEKFQALVERHPDMPQSIEAKKYLKIIDEEESWNNALNSDEIAAVDDYLQNYPNGKYNRKAKVRKAEIKELNKKQAYNYASSQNTSYAWKNFLKDYPNHSEASAIKRKIIQLEVDEIMGNSNTGKMPSFQQYGHGYSSNSSVEIKNNTGCELTVRYSGPDVKMITISVGGSKSVYLSSGNYKVVASACGAHYAGRENLGGSYGSTFYISHSRY